MDAREDEKRAAAHAAAEAIVEGMTVGLGTGSTVAHFLVALAARRLDLRCVATSLQTEELGSRLGLRIETFDQLERLDVAVDGADQVGPDFWLVKGGGGAHAREKIVAAAAARFIVIASSDKPVERIGPPVPLEVFRFGEPRPSPGCAGSGRSSAGRAPPHRPDGNVIADYGGPVDDPDQLSCGAGRGPGGGGPRSVRPESGHRGPDRPPRWLGRTSGPGVRGATPSW